jgi:Xaa-Pro aminopeptidase
MSPAEFPKSRFEMRMQLLRAALERRKLAALLVTFPLNIAYLTGFRGSASAALFTRSEAILWVDPRYILQARQGGLGVEIIEARESLLTAAVKWMKKHPQETVGFDDAHLSTRSFSQLKKESRRGVKFVAAGEMVADLRFIKDDDEIERIREASRVTAEALEETLPQIRPGVCECDLANEIDYRIRRKGAEGAAFETIVASGRRGAFPHARASRKLLEECDFVIVDVGAIMDGYVADMTRTLYLGKPDSRVRSLYNAVLEAQKRGVEALGKGVRAGDVDFAVRSVLGRKGLGRYFTHSTGHGVGMEVHENPRLGKGEKTRIQARCVVTIEPGIYMDGFGGIRIEDTVLVGADGPEILTPASKAHWFLA